MPYEPVADAAINSAVVDEFSFYVTLQPDGRARVEVSHGFNLPMFLTAGESAKYVLSLPYNPTPQPLRLAAYKEGKTTT